MGTPTFTLTPPKSFNSGDIAGFGMGLVAYALGMSYIRYGPGGPTGWFKAKFFNQPFVPSNTAPGSAGTTPQGVTGNQVPPNVPIPDGHGNDTPSTVPFNQWSGLPGPTQGFLDWFSNLTGGKNKLGNQLVIPPPGAMVPGAGPLT